MGQRIDRMAQGPKKPIEATEEGTISPFDGLSSGDQPPVTSIELTPPTGLEPPPAADETEFVSSTRIPTEVGPSETSMPPPPPQPAESSDTVPPTENVMTPTPVPGESSGEGTDTGESLGVSGQIRPGQTLFGRYLVDSKLGEGGMGTVWLVRHLELDDFRALKLIISGIAFDPQARGRFKREAKVMARLKHANAVTVHAAQIGKDAAFIEMEYIRGRSLNKVMRPGEPLPLDLVARVLYQLCDVLQEAHACKIVHRDLKPSNLMLLEGRAPGRELKVLDFGIAKILESDTDGGTDIRTSTGAFMGSALWTSPEQASGGQIDGRSDLYSVGIILYEMLTGFRPFSGQITKVIYNQLYTPPPRFAEKNPNAKVPPAIEAVVLRCLAKNPNERFQTARELAEAFFRALPEGVGAGPAMNFLASQAVRPSTIEPPTTEMAGRNVLPRTEPDNPVFGHGLVSNNALEKTWRAEDVTSPSPLDQTEVAPPIRPISHRSWSAFIPLGIMIGLIVGVVLLAISWRPRPQARWTLPPGYTAEFEPGAAPNALPVALVRVGGTITKTNGDKLVPRYIHIPGGEFRMGNDFDQANARDDDEDQPAHLVKLSDFYIQESEVTNGELEAYFIANQFDLDHRPARWKKVCERLIKAGRDPTFHPAVGITHKQAEDYARWVGGKLATEAQWEYTARSGGKKLRYAMSHDAKPNMRDANVDSTGQLGSGVTTMEVRFYPKDKTEQGVYDLTGNVREWCRDVWDDYVATEEPVIDPVGPPAPKGAKPSYVIRGGSFATPPDIHTTRPRRPDPKDSQDHAITQMAEDGTSDDIGFRVVIEWPRKP
jgi:serine/threonine protein kinase/formylglycine-generating enzyme required for sulfatase activity